MSEPTPPDAATPSEEPAAPPPADEPDKPRPAGTLLGVAPPKVATEVGGERSPVFVRSQSIADEDLAPAAAPSAPPPPASPQLAPPSEAPEAATAPPRPSSLRSAISAPVRLAGADLPLWALLAPALLLLVVAVALVAALAGSGAAPRSADVAPSAQPVAAGSGAPAASAPADGTSAERPAEAKPDETLSASEVLARAAVRSEQELTAARALRERLTNDPAAAGQEAVLRELRKYADDARTAPEALAAMARLDGHAGADLLYEIWTGTQERTPTTELARALLHAKDVRGKASPALAVALELRQAETCEQNRALLPRALKDGDKRSLHLLMKLKRTQGCGANKRQDCYACLRAGDELEATISAVKSRRAPNPFRP